MPDTTFAAELDAAAVANAVVDNTARAQSSITTENLYLLRETHMRLRRLKALGAGQLTVMLLGDSYVAGDYWSQYFAKTLQDEYGFAGLGYVGVGWFAPLYDGPYVEGGKQPTNAGLSRVDGSVRPDLSAKPVFIGTWTSAYNAIGASTPSISYVSSPTVGDRIKITMPAGHTGAVLHHRANASTVRYSWDNGTTWQATLTLDTGFTKALAGVPAAAATLLLEVVSGTPQIGGVDFQSTAPGVRVHKLGISGGATNTVALINGPATWQAALGALGADLIIAGWQTNDQGAGFMPEVAYANQLATIMARVRAQFVQADIMLTSPPENQRTNNAYPMTSYSAVTRAYARAQGFAYLNHQLNFGATPAEYVNSNARRPWQHPDGIHLTVEGGLAYADAPLKATVR